MTGSVNKVILVGNVGAKPEVRTNPGKGDLCTFPLATSQTWKSGPTGEKRSKTEWHNITVYDHPIIHFIDQIDKGTLVYVEGKLETKKWLDKNGVERSRVEVCIYFNHGKIITPSLELEARPRLPYPGTPDVEDIPF